MKITQYFPAFFEGFTPQTAEFETLEELLNIPFVKRVSWFVDFSGYVMSNGQNLDGKVDAEYLMATSQDGKEWWVIGRITGGTVDLPTWRPNETPHTNT